MIQTRMSAQSAEELKTQSRDFKVKGKYLCFLFSVSRSRHPHFGQGLAAVVTNCTKTLLPYIHVGSDIWPESKKVT